MKDLLQGAMVGSILGGCLSTFLTGSPAGLVLGIFAFTGFSAWYYRLGFYKEVK